MTSREVVVIGPMTEEHDASAAGGLGSKRRVKVNGDGWVACGQGGKMKGR